VDRQVLFVIIVIIPIALIVVPIVLAWRKELKRRGGQPNEHPPAP
jgi:hypothetical protein